MNHRWSPSPLLGALAILLAVSLASAGSALHAAPATQSGNKPFTTANGVTIQAGEPLPVFRFATPQVTSQTATSLSSLFEGVVPPRTTPPVGQENYLNRPRFTVPNTATTSLLTQYGATGGFYAYNATGIGQASQRDPLLDGPDTRVRSQAIANACQFLFSNGFIDSNGRLLVFQQVQGPQGNGASVPNLFDNCPGLFPNALPADAPETAALTTFSASPIRTTNQPSAPGSTQGAVQTIGVAVHVPIQVQVGIVGQVPRYIPLGGPGGHISLLLNALSPNVQVASLDNQTPGLGAVALPFFGRSYTKLKDVPTLDPAQVKQQVTQQVQLAFPRATGVNVPDPALFYMVSDAAQEQQALEPMLSFSGIQVTVDGNTIVLRDIMLPAVQSGSGTSGFGPTVSIPSPANNTTFSAGNVTLTGRISGGSAPFSYQWLLDDGTALSQPTTTAAAGDVTLQTNQLPVTDRDGQPAPVSVILRVQDNDGAVRQAQVTLRPDVVPLVFLPFIDRRTSLSTSAAPAAAVAPQEVTIASTNYTFGVASASDYPPYGPGGSDLPGVVPDASGFRTGLLGYGWSQRFFYSNANVWERDWRDCSLGGIDCTYGVDRTDFAYFAGHGGPGGISPSRTDRSTGWASAENARFQSVRWVGFASCQTLRVQGFAAPNEPIRRWFNSFQGSSMLLGFNSNMADIAFGPRFVDNMRIPSITVLFVTVEFPWAQLSIRDAWVKTAFDMNAGKPAYIWATSATYDPRNERLPKGGDALKPRPLPVNWFYWVWWDE
jgi:hypothetical protein